MLTGRFKKYQTRIPSRGSEIIRVGSRVSFLTGKQYQTRGL